MTAKSGPSDSIDADVIQKRLNCHLLFRKCTLTVEYIALLRVGTLIFGENKMASKKPISAKIHGFKLNIYAQTALIWNFTTRLCNATSIFDQCHYISCIRAQFAAKHKGPLSLITRWRIVWSLILDHGSRPMPYKSHSHLHRGTIPWTPPTTIYREYIYILQPARNATG